MDEVTEPKSHETLGRITPANPSSSTRLDPSPGLGSRCRELIDAFHKRDAAISEIGHLTNPSSDQLAALERVDEHVDTLIDAVAIIYARSLADLGLKLMVYRSAQQTLGREDRRADRIAQTVLRDLETLVPREGRVAMDNGEARTGTGSALPIWRFLARPDALLGRNGLRRSQA